MSLRVAPSSTLLLREKSIIFLNEDFIMNTIQQTVTIPSNRRLQLDLPLPDNIPVGPAEMLLVLSPAQEDRPPKSILDFVGCFADSATFAGDPVALQKAMRDEW